MELQRRGRLCNATSKGSAFLSTPKQALWNCSLPSRADGRGRGGGNAAWRRQKSERHSNELLRNTYPYAALPKKCVIVVSIVECESTYIVVVYSGGL